jgi:hypothetical protein
MKTLATMIEALWDLENDLEDQMYPDDEVDQGEELEHEEEEEDEEILAILDDYGVDANIFETHLFTIDELVAFDPEHANSLNELAKEFMTDDSWVRIEFNVVRELDYVGLLLSVYRKSNEWYLPCGKVEEEFNVKENNAKKFTLEIVKKITLRNKQLQLKLGLRV